MSEKDMFSPESNPDKTKKIVSDVIDKFATNSNLMLEYFRKTLGGETIKTGPSDMLKKILALYLRENHPELKEIEVDRILTEKRKEMKDVLFTPYFEANRANRGSAMPQGPDEAPELPESGGPSGSLAPRRSIAEPGADTRDRKSQAAGELDWRDEIAEDREKN